MESQHQTMAKILKEMEFQSLGTEVLLSTIEGFNPILNSDIARNTLKEQFEFLEILPQMVLSIGKGITELSEFLTGRVLQDEENRREMIEALKKIGKGGNNQEEKPPAPPKAPKEEKNLLQKFGIITGTIAGLGALLGFVAELFPSLKLIDRVIKPLRGVLVNGVGKLIGLFADGLPQLIDHLTTALKTNSFTKPFVELLEYTGKFGKKIASVGELFPKMFKTLLTFTRKIIPAFDWGLKFGKVLGAVFNKIFVIGAIVMAVFDTVIGAIDGYKKSGILGAIKGGVTGFLVGLVGSIVDLVKDGVSWVAKMFGFANFSAALDGFSFSKLLGDGVTAIVDLVTYTWDYIKGLFAPEKFMKAWEELGFTGLSLLVIGGIGDMVKGAVSWVATLFGAFDFANALDSFSIQDNLMGVVTSAVDFAKSIINQVIDMFRNAPANIGEAAGILTDMADTFSRDVLKSVLPDPRDHSGYADPLHWVAKAIPQSVYDYANMSIAEPKTTQSFRIGDGPGEPKRATLPELEDYIRNGPTKNPDMKPLPSRAGDTLNQQSSNTVNAPIIINQMGGNVTNTSTSSVSNNTSQFEPIMAGSALGFISL